MQILYHLIKVSQLYSIMWYKIGTMATLTKRGKSWLARVRKKGISISQTFPTKGMASAWATKTEADILSGNYKTGSEKTFAEAIERYAEEVTETKKSKSSEKYFLNTLMTHDMASIRVGDITTEMLAKYRNDALTRLKPASVLRYIGILSGVFEHMRTEWKWIDENPMTDLKKPQAGPGRDRIFTEDEISRVLDALGHNSACTDIQQAMGDTFLFAIESGMRAKEILGLEWDRVDTTRRFVTLPDTKNGDRRHVPLSKKAIEIIESRRDHDKPFNLKSNTLKVMFPIYLKRAGIDGACFHDTRHTAITRLAKKLIPLDLAKMAGHRRLDMTLHYYNEPVEDIAAKID